MARPRTVTEPTAAELAEFAEAWDRLARAVRRARGRISAEGPAELTLSQYHLLEALDRSDFLPVCQVADAAGVSAPTATRMLAGLERLGVVARRGTQRDRRVVEVALTAEGQRLVRAKRRAVGQLQRRTFESLPAADRRAAAGLLGRLAQAMEEL